MTFKTRSGHIIHTFSVDGGETEFVTSNRHGEIISTVRLSSFAADLMIRNLERQAI